MQTGVTSRNEFYRLHGPPGCGKSTALATAWIPGAAETHGHDQVVVCSLTRTAAAEIASRGLPIPDENAGTLHALAFRALRKPPICVAGSDMGNEWDELYPEWRLGHRGAEEAFEAGFEVPDPMERHMQNMGASSEMIWAEIEIRRHRMSPKSQWSEEALACYAAWQKFLDKHGANDFTGLIQTALEETVCAPGNPRVLIVDEAQDCSALEMALVHKWSEHAHTLVLAGDGDQAIYGFRGAHPRAFYSGSSTKDYELNQSYRVSKAVHAEAARWIQLAEDRYPVEYRPTDKSGEALVNTALRYKQPAAVMDSIYGDIEAGMSVMVLTTSGYMLDPMLDCFRAEGLAFHNPYRTEGKNSASWNPLRKVTPLRALVRPMKTPGDPIDSLWTYSELDTWLKFVSSNKALVRGAKQSVRATLALAESTEWEHESYLRLSAIKELFKPEPIDELFHALRTKQTPKLIEWVRKYFLASERRKMEPAIAMILRHGTDILFRNPSVITSTCHGVKGGEADAVYLFPDLSSKARKSWLNPGDARDGVIRTLYVGMTRARTKLVLCGASNPRNAVVW